MSQHNKTDFKHFTKEELDQALVEHHLPANKPGQLADSFRNGAEWAAGYLKAKLATPTTPESRSTVPEEDRSCENCRFYDRRSSVDPCFSCLDSYGYEGYWRPIEIISGTTNHDPI